MSAPHRHSVLVADDEVDTRVALSSLLARQGYETSAVPNGRDALAALRGGFRPCVILLDLGRPEMDGLEFRRNQMADAALAAIPVIVVSAGGWAQEEEARKLGLTTFVRKPIDMDSFAEMISRMCGQP